MNNIKFRGFSLTDKKWVYGDLIQVGTAKYILPQFWIKLENLIEVDPRSIGQWTTLLDIEGKEIYSGDFTVTFSSTKKGKTIHNPPRLVTFIKRKNYYVGYNVLARSKYLVVGNNFEATNIK